jgi:hypothetical protein
MKKFSFVLSLLVSATVAFAQDATPDASKIGVESSQQRLKEKSISKFEDPGFWKVSIPQDHGVITFRRFDGSPAEKVKLADETAAGITEEDKYVLGVKAEFYGRVNTTIAVESSRPMAVPGITKLISVWVVGRNFNHTLKVLVEDQFGNRLGLPMGKLNFSGWKKLTVAVPPTLVQRNSHFTNRSGIKILGFVIEPELTETYGSYFVYFDDLRVVTDLFAEENRDPDDVPDNW